MAHSPPAAQPQGWTAGRRPTGFEQPFSVETVDIVPTLAATIGFDMFGLDGRCLDIHPGPNDPCPIVVTERAPNRR